jgi:choline kinase
MQAIILAAGRGRRLWPFTVELPKCLLPLDGCCILEQQLNGLERAGVTEALLVCGFGVRRVREILVGRSGPLRVRLRFNPLCTITDNLISLWTVRGEMADDLILVNGDVVFHPDLLAGLLSMADSGCLVVSRKAAYDEDDMKVKLHEGRVVRVGKHLAKAETDAESVGMMRFAGSGVAALRQALEEVTQEPQACRGYFLEAVQRLVDRGLPMAAWDCGELPWADIDTPEDLRWVRQRAHLFAAAAPRYGVAEGGRR